MHDLTNIRLSIRFTDRLPGDTGALAVLVGRTRDWSGRAAELNAASGGQLQRACAAARFRGERGEICEVLAPSGAQASRVLIVGVRSAEASATEL